MTNHKTQEEYQVNRNFSIVQQGLDVYLGFLEKSLEVASSTLTADQHSALISFVQYIETELFAVTDKDVERVLSTQELLPSYYKLFCAISHNEPRSLDLSNELVEQLDSSIKHEATHQVFARLRDERILNHLNDAVDQVQPRTFEDVSDTETLQFYAEFTARKNRVANLILEVAEGKNTVENVHAELTEMNVRTLNEYILKDFSQKMQETMKFAAYLIGLEECFIAMITAKKRNTHYLTQITPYITNFNFMIPNLEILNGLENIVSQEVDIRTKVKQVIEQFYSFEKFKEHSILLS